MMGSYQCFKDVQTEYVMHCRMKSVGDKKYHLVRLYDANLEFSSANIGRELF